MGMPQTAGHWTAGMVRALPDDGNRYEVIDGELLVTPAPTLKHQLAVYQLLVLLGPYVRSAGIGVVLASPADITFEGEPLVQPDLFVAPLVAGGKTPRDWPDITRLLLVVEVLSPSTARADRQTKRRLYQRQYVPEYWIVDLDARVIERWQPDIERPEVLSDRLSWHPAGAAQPLELDLPQYFADVLDG